MNQPRHQDGLLRGELTSLKLVARGIAEGLYGGSHRSARKGPGVEFGGERPYQQGDDLRFIDKRALLRHDRLMVREFETETDRSLWLVVDATRSMSFSGRAGLSKWRYVTVLAAALTHLARRRGDPVGLVVLGTDTFLNLSGRGDTEDRVVAMLEATECAPSLTEEQFSRALLPLGDRARKGSTLLLLSDMVDLPPNALRSFCALGSRGRHPFGAMVLTPEEATLPFEGSAKFNSAEGAFSIVTDPAKARSAYLEALHDQESTWHRALEDRGGGLITATTAEAPLDVLRRMLRSISGQSNPAGPAR